MCHFIVGSLPADCDMRSLKPILSSYGHFYDAIPGPKPPSLKGEAWFRVNRNPCDCGTFLGSTRQTDDEERSAQALPIAEEWCALFHDLLEHVDHAGLVLAWGDLERVRLAGPEEVSLGDLVPDLFLRMEDNVHYVVRR